MAAETATTAMDTIQSALTSGFTSMVGDVMTAIGNVLPVVLPIFGAMMVISIVIGLVRKFKRS